MDSKESANLSDSWMDVSGTMSQHQANAPLRRGTSSDAGLHVSLEAKVLAKLLRDAQDGSGMTSYTGSGRESPPSPPPSREEGETYVQVGAEWFWEWSSRPEVGNEINSADSNGGEGTPSVRDGPERAGEAGAICEVNVGATKLRHSWLMRSGTTAWMLDHMPSCLLSHACSFLIGAAAMFLIIRKYSKWIPSN